MVESLSGKTVVITGASGIIGSRVAELFRDAGACLVLLDIESELLESQTRKLKKDSSAVLAVSCDVSRPKDVESAVEQAVKAFGKVDVLFNNAATKTKNLDAFFEPFETYSLETWREILSVNLDGMMLMAQAVGKQMKQSGGGSIIQTASIYGVCAPDSRIYEGSLYMNRQINTPAAYSASKGAVIALSKHLATYWASSGIRVNSISPGGVESGQNEIFRKNYSQRVPLGRMATTDEIGQVVLFLASDASQYITGQNIMVDGGLSAW